MGVRPVLITQVSTSYFSVARYYGGAKINGEEYTYCPERDILIRRDWVNIYNRLQWEDFISAVESGVKPELSKTVNTKKQEVKQITPSLFD